MNITVLNFSIKEGVSAKGNSWKMARITVLYLDRFGKTQPGTLVAFETEKGSFDVLKEGGKYQVAFSPRPNERGQLEFSPASFKPI